MGSLLFLTQESTKRILSRATRIQKIQGRQVRNRVGEKHGDKLACPGTKGEVTKKFWAQKFLIYTGVSGHRGRSIRHRPEYPAWKTGVSGPERGNLDLVRRTLCREF
jgi:hypothetical protein